MINEENYKIAIKEIKEGLEHIEEAVQCFYYAEEEVGNLSSLYDDLSELTDYYLEKVNHLKSLIIKNGA